MFTKLMVCKTLFTVIKLVKLCVQCLKFMLFCTFILLHIGDVVLIVLFIPLHYFNMYSIFHSDKDQSRVQLPSSCIPLAPSTSLLLCIGDKVWDKIESLQDTLELLGITLQTY